MKAIALLLILSLISSIHSQVISTGNDVLQRALSAAIQEMNQDLTSDMGFHQIHINWFGNTPIRGPLEACLSVYPQSTEITGALADIIYKKRILWGGNIPDVPKRFNFTQVANETFGTTVGFESDLAASIAYRLSQQYSVAPQIQSYWVPSIWYLNSTDNIIANLQSGQFDAIMAGMSIFATWPDPKNTSNQIPRTDLIQFTCAYQDSGDGAVQGPRPLPDGARPINDTASLNQTGLIICVNTGTAMATYADQYLQAATVIKYVNGPDAQTYTLSGQCHLYLAPLINAAWDAEHYANLTLAVSYYPSNDPLGIGIRMDSASAIPTTIQPTNAHSDSTSLSMIASITLLSLFISMS